MSTVQEVKNFLKKHNYAIIVKTTEEGCEVTFPFKKNLPKLDVNLLRFRFENDKMYCNENSGEIPEYAFRLLTCCIIFKFCLQIGYNSRYIILLDKDGVEYDEKVDILQVMSPPKEKDVRAKDANLIAIFCEAWPSAFVGFDSIAAEYDVEEGYGLVKQLFVEEKDE